METPLAFESAGRFRAADKHLGTLDADIAANLLAAAADLVVMIDQSGIVRDVAYSTESLSDQGLESWIGQRWADTVTPESRPKIGDLLREAGDLTASRWRQVNHPSRRGPDIPIRYSALKAGRPGRIIALGRDLTAMAVLQQQLIEAQFGMEREYARLRHAETRYRLLFQIAAEAVLIVDATTNRIVDANPAAGRALGRASTALVGRPLLDLFDPAGIQAVQALLSRARTTGGGEGTEARLVDTGQPMRLAASMFRQENGSSFLLRLSDPSAGEQQGHGRRAQSRLHDIVGELPEGFVVTTPDRRILTANQAFLDLVQLASEEQALREPLDRWLGRSGVDVSVLAFNLKEHGSVRNFPMKLRGQYGTVEDVEVSAVSVLQGEEPCLGFVIRPQFKRPGAETRPSRQLPHSVEQLSELIGRVPLKDLVRETTDVIERLCIEAALQLTGDNRASAAQMLGVSRQSLYVKLRRYGIADSDSDPAAG